MQLKLSLSQKLEIIQSLLVTYNIAAIEYEKFYNNKITKNELFNHLKENFIENGFCKILIKKFNVHDIYEIEELANKRTCHYRKHSHYPKLGHESIKGITDRIQALQAVNSELINKINSQ